MANNTWWPDVSDRNGAETAILGGSGAAAFVASVTAGLALTSIFLHKPILGIDGSGLADAVLFAAIGFGIYKKSRTAAVAGLALYLTERVYMLSTGRATTSAGIMTIIVALYFVHGVRGTFAYRRFNNQKVVPETPVTSGE